MAASSPPRRKALCSSQSSPEICRHELATQSEPAIAVKEKEAAASAEKQGLWALLKKMIGADLTTISMPMYLHEPMTFLQRMTENLQYHHLLTEAGNTDDRIRQMTLTAAFAVAAYSSNSRLKKPFNPYLGETFQWEDRDAGVRFLAEQVSHHPPVGVCILEGRNFVFWQDMLVKTRFGGNSLDVTPTGEWHVRFKNNGNHISWSGVKTVIHSIIIGSLWIDCFGDTEVVSLTHGEKALVQMKECGTFGRGRWTTTCKVMDAAGKVKETFSGKWNAKLTNKKGDTVWEHALGEQVPGDKYGRTQFIFNLTAREPEWLQRVPATDSRHRKDWIALYEGDSDRASAEKRQVEQTARDAAAQRQRDGVEYQPRWFARGRAPDSDTEMWLYKGGYWEQYGTPELNTALGHCPAFV